MTMTELKKMAMMLMMKNLMNENRYMTIVLSGTFGKPGADCRKICGRTTRKNSSDKRTCSTSKCWISIAGTEIPTSQCSCMQ